MPDDTIKPWRLPEFTDYHKKMIRQGLEEIKNQPRMTREQFVKQVQSLRKHSQEAARRKIIQFPKQEL